MQKSDSYLTITLRTLYYKVIGGVLLLTKDC